MFFTPELLSRRDSGFGLLWLAATLGSKSSFRKLPRRSVATADIPELCGLIAEPPEPLALRLSSNLMIGVARVYKVKQEILFTDVTTCFNTLKKAVQDLHASSNVAAQLQMGQPSVRADAVTVTVDPGSAFAIDFDHLFAAWADERPEAGNDESDEEYGSRPSSKAKRAKDRSASATGYPRGDLHTLKESHLVLSASLDGSFPNDGFGAIVPSSSQIDGFAFEDNFLDVDALDAAVDIGDELARELGEGWGAPISHAGFGNFEGDMHVVDEPMPNFEFDADVAMGEQAMDIHAPNAQDFASQAAEPQEEAEDAFYAQNGSVIVPLSPLGADASDREEVQTDTVQKKTKRVRLLLDARTELTNEELQRARSHYLEEQAALRREIARKKAEKESEKMLEEMILGVPNGLHAKVLVDFWLENFRLQVEARSGQLHLESEGEPPRKRRRVNEFNETVENDTGRDFPGGIMDVDVPFGVDEGPGFASMEIQDNDFGMDSRMRSSEEPGQARRASRAPSLLGGSQFGIEPQATQISGSQRSALYPWDNAGFSSSAGGAFSHIGLTGRGSSLSGRGRKSPMHPMTGLPDDFAARDREFDSDGFEFAVPGDKSLEDNTQKSDANIMMLERQSLNFLEYAKMQVNAMPVGASSLSFDDVVPKTTSTPHVAAAAFYHCLVLATKNLIAVEQEESFGAVMITVI